MSQTLNIINITILNEARKNIIKMIKSFTTENFETLMNTKIKKKIVDLNISLCFSRLQDFFDGMKVILT